MLGLASMTFAQRQQELTRQVGENLQNYRNVYQKRGPGLKETSERIWAMGREAGERAKALQQIKIPTRNQIDIEA